MAERATVHAAQSSGRPPSPSGQPALRAERLLDQRARRRRQLEREGGGAPARRHLAPGALEDLHQLRLVVLGSEGGELVLEEHQAGGVLERQRLGIVRQALLAQQVADPLDGRRRRSRRRARISAARPRVELAAVAPPAQVALAAVGIGGPLESPAAQVLRAGREPQRLAGVGLEALEPAAHAPRVEELLGLGRRPRPSSRRGSSALAASMRGDRALRNVRRSGVARTPSVRRPARHRSALRAADG